MSVWDQSMDAYGGGYDPERYQRPYRLEANSEECDWDGSDSWDELEEDEDDEEDED